MSQACSGATGGAARRNGVRLGAVEGLALAASPTFGFMALLSGIGGGGPAAMLCSAEHGSLLSGMLPMYLLMSAFHLGPWLKLIRVGGWRN